MTAKNPRDTNVLQKDERISPETRPRTSFQSCDDDLIRNFEISQTPKYYSHDVMDDVTDKRSYVYRVCENGARDE